MKILENESNILSESSDDPNSEKSYSKNKLFGSQQRDSDSLEYEMINSDDKNNDDESDSIFDNSLSIKLENSYNSIKELDEKNNTISSLKTKLSELESFNQKLELKTKILEEELIDERMKNLKFSQTLSELKYQSNNHKSIDPQSNSKQKDQEIENLKKQNENILSLVDQLRNENQSLSQTISQSHQKFQNQTESHQIELEERNQEIENLKKQNENILSLVDQLRNENQSLSQTISQSHQKFQNQTESHQIELEEREFDYKKRISELEKIILQLQENQKPEESNSNHDRDIPNPWQIQLKKTGKIEQLLNKN